MKLGVLAGGPVHREAGLAGSEDPLDRYRRYVERHLGDKLVLLEEDTFDRFFDHIIANFNRGVLPDECARTWLRSPSHPSPPRRESERPPR